MCHLQFLITAGQHQPQFCALLHTHLLFSWFPLKPGLGIQWVYEDPPRPTISLTTVLSKWKLWKLKLRRSTWGPGLKAGSPSHLSNGANSPIEVNAVYVSHNVHEYQCNAVRSNRIRVCDVHISPVSSLFWQLQLPLSQYYCCKFSVQTHRFTMLISQKTNFKLAYNMSSLKIWTNSRVFKGHRKSPRLSRPRKWHPQMPGYSRALRINGNRIFSWCPKLVCERDGKCTDMSRFCSRQYQKSQCMAISTLYHIPRTKSPQKDNNDIMGGECFLWWKMHLPSYSGK